MSQSLVFGLWSVLWLIYIVNNFFSGFVLEPVIGEYLAHVYRNIVIIPVYFYIALLYVKIVKNFGFSAYPRMTGFIWMSMSIMVDYFFWRVFFDFPHAYLMDQYKFWEGRLYIVQLLALLVAPSITRKHRRKFKRDPIINLILKGKLY